MLIRFDSISSSTILSSTPITNLGLDEKIQGIDFRPANRQLYALTTDHNQTGRLYTINPTTGVATLASTISVPVTGTRFGIDFNPVPDRLRIVSDTALNLRVDVSTGVATVDGTLAYLAGDVNFGQNPSVVGSAYANNYSGATATTLYQIDTNLDILAIQAPPNNGTLSTVGSLGVDASAVVGFDIRTVWDTNSGYATLDVGGTTSLYQIDLATGAARLIGSVGAPLTGLAIVSEGLISKVDGSTATFTGSAADDTLVIDQAGGLLRHNQFGHGVPGYASAFDFDSVLPGDQTLSSTDAAVSVVVNAGAGNDKVSLGSASTPLSSLPTSFTINLQEGINNQLRLNDRASEVARNITVTPGLVTGFGAPVMFDSDFGDRNIAGNFTFLKVDGGKGNDVFNLTEAFGLSRFRTIFDGGGGFDVLNADARGASVAVTLTSLHFLPFQTYQVFVDYVEIAQANVVNVRSRNLDPAVAPLTISATAGTEVADTIVARFHDYDPGSKAADYQVTIQWGDGTTSEGRVVQDENIPHLFSVLGSHRYLVTGQFTVTTTIVDLGGQSTIGGYGSTNDPELDDNGLPISSVDTAYYYISTTTTFLPGEPISTAAQAVVTSAPFVVVGRLDAASDTGLSNQDGITKDNTPTFSGTSAPGSVVNLFLGTDPTTRQLIATAIADSNGVWQATVMIPLADGVYTNLVAEATALDGETRATSSLPGLMIDTVGPRVTNLAFARLSGRMSVTLQDDRSGLAQARFADPASYTFTGRSVLGPRRNGPFRITGVTMSPPGAPTDPQVVNLAINNGRQIRGGTFKFTAHSGGIEDLAGNALDGEFTGSFPSGNAQPGGDFAARLRSVLRDAGTPTPLGTSGSQPPGALAQRRSANPLKGAAVRTNAANAHPAGLNPLARLANRPQALIAVATRALGRKFGR
ncbi:DUF4394 domain-containing protein [Singulisphaera sp. Ch08]|uniref:DUF4394 domain-containing protein n=1 Tax=Singulisphaera sp. Ch08 TaxID=3120278 RepID=A0AAU7C726_9BACT